MLAGFAMNFMLSNTDYQKKKLGMPTTEELEEIDQKRDAEVKELICKKSTDV